MSTNKWKRCNEEIKLQSLGVSSQLLLTPSQKKISPGFGMNGWMSDAWTDRRQNCSVCLRSAFAPRSVLNKVKSLETPNLDQVECGHCHWPSITKHLIASTVCSDLCTRVLGLHDFIRALRLWELSGKRTCNSGRLRPRGSTVWA